MDGKLYGLDTFAGEVILKFKTRNYIFSSPAIVDGIIYFGSGDGNFYALDPKAMKKEQELWRFFTG